MNCVITCDKCGYIVTNEDDYGGTYVFDHGKYYHWICYEDIHREGVERLLKKMEEGNL